MGFSYWSPKTYVLLSFEWESFLDLLKNNATLDLTVRVNFWGVIMIKYL